MRRQRKKAYVSNPLANATGKQYNDSGKTLTLDTSKLGQAGKLANSTQKPYKPVECGMYKLPKYFLPDVETAARYKKNKSEAIMKLFEKYPSLDYVSVYNFSTKENQVNKDVWERFLYLYDNGFIGRIYNKINGYFTNGLQNYVKTHSQQDCDVFFDTKRGVDNSFLTEEIHAEITPNNGFKSDTERLRVLRNLIHDFITTPNELFEAMYDNARQFLINEAKKFDLTIIGIKEDPAIPMWQTNKDGKSITLFTRFGNLGAAFDYSLWFNQVIHRDTKKENDKQILYTVAIKDNLQQLQVSTKSISQSENEDGRENGDYPQGGGDEDAGGGGNNGKNSDKTMLLLGVGILAAIFFLKRFKH